jgi:ABC-type amino acid transport substrate-binding protein
MTKRMHVTWLMAAVILGIAALFVLTRPTTGPGAKPTETAYERVIRTGELRCAYGMGRPWLYHDQDGQLTGLLHQLTEEMGRRLSVKIIWDGGDVGWEGVALALQSGKADMACSTLWQSAARGRVLSFTRPLWFNQVRLYTRVKETRFDEGSYERLNAKDVRFVASDGGESAKIVAQHFPRAAVVSLPNSTPVEEFFLNVTTNKADVVAADVGVMRNFIAANPGMIKEIPTPQPLEVYPSAYALAIDQPMLRDMIDSAVAELIHTGYVARLLADEIRDNPGSFLLPAPAFDPAGR